MNMKNGVQPLNHLAIDFETWGKKANSAAIIDCSAMVFTFEKMISDQPYTTADINLVTKFKLSAQDQKQFGYIIEPGGVEFWRNQPVEIRQLVAPKSTDITLREFKFQFLKFLESYGKIDYWWSRSNTFDPIILWRIFESLNSSELLDEYLRFWRVRDFRTFIDAKFNFTTQNGFCPISDDKYWAQVFQEHNSSWDVLADVLRVQAIVRAEHDLKQISQ